MTRELIVRAQAGDVDAYSALVGRLIDRMYATARLIVRDDERARDAVQDALLRAWLDLRGLRDPDRFEAWLWRLLARSCQRAARGHRRRSVTELRLEPDFDPPTSDDVRLVAVRDQLDRGFERLSTEHRTVLVLRHYAGLSLLETADALGVPVGTVQSRLNRATAAMRAVIDADERPTDLAMETFR